MNRTALLTLIITMSTGCKQYDNTTVPGGEAPGDSDGVAPEAQTTPHPRPADVTPTTTSPAKNPPEPDTVEEDEDEDEEPPRAVWPTAPQGPLCARIEARQRAHLQDDTLIRYIGEWEEDALSALTRCISSPDVAWGLALGPSRIDDEGAYRADVMVIATDASGALAEHTLGPLSLDGDPGFACGVDPSRMEHVNLGDQPALAFEASSGCAEDSFHDTNWLASFFTLKDGAIVEHDTGLDMPVMELEDFDGDGRLDLFAIGFTGEPGVCYEAPRGANFHQRIPYHGLPDGSFRFDDVARAKLLERCPVPITKLRWTGKDSDLDEQVACALLWGAEPDALRAQLEALCPGGNACVESCSDQTRCLYTCFQDNNLCDRDACFGHELRVRWTGSPPPLRLDTP